MSKIFEPGVLEKDTVDTLKKLGETTEDAKQMANFLKIEKAWEAIHASQLVYFANEIKKFISIDFKKILHNTLTDDEWRRFDDFVKKVLSKKISVSTALYQFLSWFGQMSYNAIKEFATNMFTNACYIYNNTSITNFFNYFKTIKITAGAASLSVLDEPIKKLKDINEKLASVYSKCIHEYKDLVLKHVLDNEITKIKSSDLNHILYMLQELSILVGKARDEHKKILKQEREKQENEKNDLKKKIKNHENKYQRRKIGGYIAVGAITLLAGVIAGVVTGITGGVAVGAGVGIFAGAVSVCNILLQDDLENSTESRQYLNNLKKKLKEIDSKIINLQLREEEIIKKYDKFLDNIDKFKDQIEQIKQQHNIKTSMHEECESVDDLALFLAKQNGDDKNEEFVKIYCDALKKLGATSYQKFIKLEIKDIEEGFDQLNKKYKNDNKTVKLLKFIRKVIEKYCMDSHVVTTYLSPIEIFDHGQDNTNEKTWEQILIEWGFSKYRNAFYDNNWIDVSKWKKLKKIFLVAAMTKEDTQDFMNKVSKI